MSFLLNPFWFAEAEEGGGALPAGADATLDFIHEFYYAGGAERTLDEVLGDGPDTTQAGGGLNEAALVAGGLLISYPDLEDVETVEAYTNRPYAIGPLLSDLLAGIMAGCTLVFDIEWQDFNYGMVMLITDAPAYSEMFDWIDLQADDSRVTDGYDVSVGSGLTTGGRHRIAITINRDSGGGNRQYAWSLDGATALTDSITYADPFPTTTPSHVMFGHDGDNDKVFNIAYLREITLYPAKLPSELPALSAIPLDATASVSGQALSVAVGSVTVDTGGVDVTATVSGQALTVAVGTVSVTTTAGTTTLNPSDKDSGVTLSGGDLVATNNNNTQVQGVRAVHGKSSGKYYWEATYTTNNNVCDAVGLCRSTYTLNKQMNNSTTGDGYVAIAPFATVRVWVDGANTNLSDSIVSGTIIGVAVDLDARLIWYRKGGFWNGASTSTQNPETGLGGIAIPTGTLYPLLQVGSTGSAITANFGASSFNYTLPSGFTSGWPA